MPPDTFRTLSTAATAEPPRVKGSRFIGEAFPARSPEEALSALDEVRRREHSATHHVWAYRLGADGSEVRSSDDGEPNGSGGVPVLRAIEGADVTNCLVVVTRYYGGTKLGTGGLARAYGDAAAAALASSKIVRRVVRLPVRLRFEFSDTSAAMRLLDRFDAIVAEQRHDADGTELDLRVRVSEVQDLSEAFVNDTAGRGQVCELGGVGSGPDHTHST